jgi:outer membrane protein assembly factor BamA
VSSGRLLGVERDLYRLGLFSRVDVRLAPGPEGAEARGVIVEVEEGKTRRLSLGAGYDSDGGARGLATLGEGNLFGRAGNLQLDLLSSQRDARFRLVYAEPRVFGWPWNATATTYWERRERTSYDLRRWGTQIGLSREWEAWRLRLIYDYHIVELPRVEDFLEVPVGSRNARVSSLTPVVGIERRDDPLDPQRGWNGLVQLQYAAPLLSADAHFVKLFFQGSYNLPMGGLGTLATGLRVGGLEPIGSGVPDDSTVAGNVPIDERFFAGGRTTHRAFGQDLLGVPEETLLSGNPVGGNGLFLANLDWRFPIAGDFGGTVFLDGGNVWRTRQEVDIRDLRWGAGVGVRYRSPVGPLRLEVGWNLDRAPGEPAYVWFFSLGNPF